MVVRPGSAFLIAALLLVGGAVGVPTGSGSRGRPASIAKQGANSQTFVDATGDQQGAAPDLTTVHIENDDEGTILFEIAFANRTDLIDGDFISVSLSTDQSLVTGCGEGVGAEYVFTARAHTPPEEDTFVLFRCADGQLDLTTPQGSFTGTFDTAVGALLFRVNRRDLGNAETFQLAVVASSNLQVFDTAGDGVSRWLYDVIATPVPPDRTAPTVRAFPSTGVHGRTAGLRYMVSDDSGKTREEIKVYGKRKRVLWVKRTRLQFSDPGRRYQVVWQVPRTLKARLRFCVRAWDESGNRSPQSCAAVIVK